MKHLTDPELSAYLDGANEGADAERVKRHLAACQPCREALAELAAQDQALRPVLSHDPGEEYFAGFARRVDDRIRAAGLAGAPARGDGFDLGRFFRSPRALAWVGAVAVVVVGGGLALMTSREGTPPVLRDHTVDRLIGRSAPAPAAPAAPPSSTTPSASSEAAGPPVEQEATPGSEAQRLRMLERKQGEMATAKGELKAPARSPADEQAAAPARAMEVRRTESGEEVPVQRKDTPAIVPAPTAAGNVTGEARARKKTMAEPMQKQAVPVPAGATPDAARPHPETAPGLSFAAPPSGAASPSAPLTQSSVAGEVRVCGDVRDPQGRPIAGAQVVASDLGRTAMADAQGRFCLSLPPGEHPVSVMAVGYAAIRHTLRAGEGEARLTLAAVPVLEGDGVAAPKSLAIKHSATVNRVTEVPSAASQDLDAALPDSLRVAVREAERLEADAIAHPSAARFDAAAAAWDRSLTGLTGGPLEIESRRRLSTARYRAWELVPTADRARAAVETLQAYVARAPAGPERARAAAWLERLGR